MTPREERLLRIEERSAKRIKRRRVLFTIAWGFEDKAKANRYADLTTEALSLHSRLWNARVEAGTRRWALAFDDARQVATVVEA